MNPNKITFNRALLVVLVAALMTGCALTREESSQKAQTASNYELCEAVQVGIALGQVRFPDTVFAEIANRRLDCAPYAKANEDRLKIALARIANETKTIRIEKDPPVYQAPTLYPMPYLSPSQTRTTHCRPDYAGGMRCTGN